MSAYVIAEAGSCHDGDFALAKDLVAIAADVGAQAVKYQFWGDANALADRRRVPQFYRDFYRQYAVPRAWLQELRDVATLAGLDFMCTAFLPDDVAIVAPYVAHFKVASFEAATADLMEAHVPFVDDDIRHGRKRLVFVSLGMGATSSGVRALDSGTRGRHVRYLHCTSAYPAPVDQLNLRRIMDDHLDGFSDHSDPALTWTGALAVAAGAHYVEAHLRHQRTSPENPDYGHAMHAAQFADYVRHVRFAEAAVGTFLDGQTGARPCEEPMMAYRSRS